MRPSVICFMLLSLAHTLRSHTISWTPSLSLHQLWDVDTRPISCIWTLGCLFLSQPPQSRTEVSPSPRSISQVPKPQTKQSKAGLKAPSFCTPPPSHTISDCRPWASPWAHSVHNHQVVKNVSAPQTTQHELSIWQHKQLKMTLRKHFRQAINPISCVKGGKSQCTGDWYMNWEREWLDLWQADTRESLPLCFSRGKT